MCLPRTSSRRRASLFASLLAIAISLSARAAETPCVGGMAGPYPCQNVDLLAFISSSTMGGGEGNVVWGWVDPVTRDEYALFGMSNGLAIVRISNPESPVYMGKLPKHSTASESIWRDVRVFQDHAFVVADNAGNHGMQVFDLTQLRSVSNPPVNFTETAWYGGSNLQSTHTIWINEASGYAYAVGINSSSCNSGGLHMIDISNPTSPTFAGCYDGDGYTHEAQCVTYNGPDAAHAGDEICFNCNGDELAVVDVTNKSNPVRLSPRVTYPGLGYPHQANLTPDQRYLLLNDEFDEFTFGHNSRTRIFDVSDLENPVLLGYYDGATAAVDHNLYIKADHVYEANYRAGLRIMELTNVAAAQLTAKGYFDVYPSSNAADFNGSWMAYPYFPSGVVAVTSIESGLFIVEPTFCTLAVSPATLPDATSGQSYSQTLSATPGTGPYYFTLNGTLPAGLSLSNAGVLSGVPTTPGAYTFKVRVADAGPCTGAVSYNLVVNPSGCPTITLSPPTVPDGTVGTPYSQAITASGGTAPYSYAVASGSLPAGLTLSATGLLSGTPTSAGTSSFSISATDAASCSGIRSYAMTVSNPGCGTIDLQPTTLAGATIFQPYSETITASGGATPYSFAITSGTLPPGITLSSSGLLSGTTGVAGSFPVTVTATDAASCTGSRAYVLDVAEEDELSFVVGTGLGQPNANRVRVFAPDGSATGVDFLAFQAGQWGVNVAGGDTDGGTAAEILAGPGPGTVYGPQVRGFDRDGVGIAKVNYFAYGTLKYGVNVTSGELDNELFRHHGDDNAEIVTGAGPGEVFGPHVRGWNHDGLPVSPMPKVSFFAFGTLRYGVNVGTGDVEADTFAEILGSPGPGPTFGAQVRGFNYDGNVVAAIANLNFTAFAVNGYGAVASAGDVDADGYDELGVAPGPGPGTSYPSQVKGFHYDGVGISPVAGMDWIAHPTHYGARVAFGQLDHSAMRHISSDEIVTGAGRDPAADSTVKTWSYGGSLPTEIIAPFVPFGSMYGVSVATSNLHY